MVASSRQDGDEGGAGVAASGGRARDDPREMAVLRRGDGTAYGSASRGDEAGSRAHPGMPGSQARRGARAGKAVELTSLSSHPVLPIGGFAKGVPALGLTVG